MTLWNCWIVVRLFLIPMIGGISHKRRQWLMWGYGDTRLPSLRTRGPKCHTSRAEMSHKQGQNVTEGPNVTQSCYNDYYCYHLPSLAPSQWETLLQYNAVSHWLGANLESAHHLCPLNVKQVLHTLSMAPVTSEHQKGQGSMPQISIHTWEVSPIKDNDMGCVGF